MLNSLAEEKLQASIRCLARHGRFLEIGKYDLSNDSPLGKYFFDYWLVEIHCYQPVRTNIYLFFLDELVIPGHFANTQISWTDFVYIFV